METIVMWALIWVSDNRSSATVIAQYNSEAECRKIAGQIDHQRDSDMFVFTEDGWEALSEGSPKHPKNYNFCIPTRILINRR
jgi:hypothetical protein